MLGRDCLFFSTLSLVRALFSFSFSRSLSLFSLLFLSICMTKGRKRSHKFLPFCVRNSPVKTVTTLSTVKENNHGPKANYADLPAWSSVCDAAVWCLACWTSLSSGRSSGGGAGGHTRWGDWPRPNGDREGSLLGKKRSRVIKRFTVKQKVEVIYLFIFSTYDHLCHWGHWQHCGS